MIARDLFFLAIGVLLGSCGLLMVQYVHIRLAMRRWARFAPPPPELQVPRDKYFMRDCR